MADAEDVSLAQEKLRKSISSGALSEYAKKDLWKAVDKATWSVINRSNTPITGELKLAQLRMRSPVFFDGLIKRWEQPARKERDILAEVAKEHGVEAPTKIPVPFTREFYTAMKQSGYTKFDPQKLAKVYNRLEEIATCDYVEPRDAIAASKVILQYNDMDVTQMQKQNKDMKDEVAMSEVKSLVSNLKKEFGKTKETVIEVDSETTTD